MVSCNSGCRLMLNSESKSQYLKNLQNVRKCPLSPRRRSAGLQAGRGRVCSGCACASVCTGARLSACTCARACMGMSMCMFVLMHACLCACGVHCERLHLSECMHAGLDWRHYSTRHPKTIEYLQVWFFGKEPWPEWPQRTFCTLSVHTSALTFPALAPPARCVMFPR